MAARKPATKKKAPARRPGGEVVEPDALVQFAPLLRLDRRDGLITSVWVTAEETPRGISAAKLLERLLARPDFASVEEVRVGLHQWNNSHAATYSGVLNVLEARRPPLRSLALGDFVNEALHRLDCEDLHRVDALYPSLDALSVSLTSLPSLGALHLKAARTVVASGLWFDPAALASFARPWPSLEDLTVSWVRGADDVESVASWKWLLDGRFTPKLTRLTLGGSSLWAELVPALARSKLLPRLRRLVLRSPSEPERDLGPALREHATAFAHLEHLGVPRSVDASRLVAAGLAAKAEVDPTQSRRHR